MIKRSSRKVEEKEARRIKEKKEYKIKNDANKLGVEEIAQIRDNFWGCTIPI